MLDRIFGMPTLVALVMGGSVISASTNDEPGMNMPGTNHQRYATPPATMPATQPAKVYTCSMHPDVTADKPGKCPKCDMNLELKKPTADGSHSSHGNVE